MAKPKQNTKRLVAYVSAEMEKALQDEAEEKGTNVSNLIRMILKEREKNNKNRRKTGMTIADVKKEYEGRYEAVEVYKPIEGEVDCFHTDNCVSLGGDSSYGNYTEDMEVSLYELMDEEEYNNTLLANGCLDADFDEWYGDKNAKILCIMVK